MPRKITPKAPTPSQLLRDWRDKHGFTQTELGNLVGRTGQTIYNYERGHKIPKSFWPALRAIRKDAPKCPAQ